MKFHKIHTLKTFEASFERMLRGEKTATIRFNDRDFQRGDGIVFNPCENGKLLYIANMFEITHVSFFPDGMRNGYVMLSLKNMDDSEELKKPVEKSECKCGLDKSGLNRDVDCDRCGRVIKVKPKKIEMPECGHESPTADCKECEDKMKEMLAPMERFLKMVRKLT